MTSCKTSSIPSEKILLLITTNFWGDYRTFERRIVVTRFDSRRKLAYDIFDKVKDRYGDLVCNTRISENVALATSPMYGLDVFAYGPNTPGAADYMALTIELMKSGFFEETMKV